MISKFGTKVKGVLQFVFSRLVVTGLLLLLQAVWLFFLFYKLTEYAQWLTFVGIVISVIMCAALIRQDTTPPEIKISWMVLFMVMPVQGGLLYLLWGDHRPALQLRRKLERAGARIRPMRTPQPAPQAALEQADPRAGRTAAYLRDYGHFPVYADTEATYYPSGEAMFPDMLAEMEKAEKYIFVEFFIISQGRMWDTVHELLRRKAAAGIDVRLIYDDTGCVTGLPVRYWKKLEAEGIRALSFNPFVPMLNLVMNNRDHRKILVIDGKVAFTGGINLADEYINEKVRFGYWRDTGVRLRGPAAWSFTTMFLEFWAANRPKTDERAVPRPVFPAGEEAGDCLVQPFCDSPVDDECIAKNVYLELINQAERELLITTPYLIADSDLITALKLAAKRGVDVRIYTPGIPDKPTVYQLTRSYFATLIRAGIKIFTFTPGFLHSKTWLCDGRIGAVGSINLDYRSLYLHFECSTLLYGGQVLEEIRADMMDLESQCREVALRDCRTSWLGTLVSAALRLVAPLC